MIERMKSDPEVVIAGAHKQTNETLYVMASVEQWIDCLIS